MKCFECDAPAEHQHHVIPESLGGTRTLPLCERCHGLVHDRGMVGHVRLTKLGLERARAEGRMISGKPAYGLRQISPGSTFLEEDPREQETILKACAMRVAGLSLRDVAAALAEQGYLSRNKTEFTPNAIMHMIARKKPGNMRATTKTPGGPGRSPMQAKYGL